MTNAIALKETQPVAVEAEVLEPETSLQLTSSQSEFSSEDELIVTWLREKSPSTIQNYRSCIREFAVFNGGSAINTTFTTLQNWRESLCQRHRVATANKKLSAVRSLLRFALEMGYLDRNPASKLRTIPNSKDKGKQSKSVNERIISNGEVRRLIDNASNQRNRAMIKTCYILGLRIHELLNLHWQDFSRTPSGGYKVKVIGKNAKERFIDVPNNLVTELEALGTNDYIFQSYKGKPLAPVSAHKMLKQTVARAGLSSEISWHWLRHCCASHSLENGASLEGVRKKLGHSNISITSVYVHSDENVSQFVFV